MTLACDASPRDVSVILSHTYEDETEKPFCYASRSLTNAERNYSQMEHEGLSITTGIKKFHQFLLGRKFILLTVN